MTARKPSTAPKKRASGPTIPESRRKAVQVLLRLPPDDAAALDRWAKRHGATRSGAVLMLLALAGD